MSCIKNIVLFALFLLLTAGMQRATANDIDTVWTRYMSCTHVDFSSDDSRILAYGGGNTKILDTQTGNLLKEFNGFGKYSKDGKIIFLSHLNELDNYIELFDAKTYESIKIIQLPKLNDSYGIILSNDGKLIAAVGTDDIYFIDIETGTVKKYLDKIGDEGRPIRTASYLFTNDNKFLIITIGDPVKGSYGEMMFINTETYQMEYKLTNRPKLLAISSDDLYLAFTSYDSDKAVLIMNTQTHEIVKSIPGIAGAVSSMAFSPDGKYFAVSDDNRYTNIYYTSDLSLFDSVRFSGWRSLQFTKNNEYFVGGGSSRLVLFNFFTTSLKDTSKFLDVIYPNPTNNLVILSLDLPKSTDLRFNLYNIDGLLISKLKQQYYNSGIVTENFNLNELANGNYFLKVESLQFNKTFKVIINK